MKNRTIALIGLALAGMMASWSANAAPVVVNWCGDKAFDEATCQGTLGGFTDLVTESNTLTITGDGRYGDFNTDGVTAFLIQVLTGGTWQTVASWDYDGSGFENISSVTLSLFTQGVVSGIQFFSEPNATMGNTNYKKFDDMGSTVFTFSCNDCTVIPPDDTPVPEPGTLALLGLGLAGLGFSRRRSMKKS